MRDAKLREHICTVFSNHTLLYYPFIFVKKNFAVMACKCTLKGLQFSIRTKNYLHTLLVGTFQKSQAKAISVSRSWLLFE